MATPVRTMASRLHQPLSISHLCRRFSAQAQPKPNPLAATHERLQALEKPAWAEDFEVVDVRYDQDKNLIWLTNNRGPMNAMAGPIVAELHLALDHIERDPARVVVWSGLLQRAFAAGLDLSAGFGGQKTKPEHDAVQGRYMNAMAHVVTRINKLKQPVINAVHGGAVGMGLAWGLAGDVVIVGDSAKLAVTMVKLGLTGAEGGVSYTLPKMLGRSLTNEMMLTGRMMQGPEAAQRGLASKCVPDDQLMDEALAMAQQMLEASPKGLRMTKEMINTQADAAGLSMEQTMTTEDGRQLWLIKDKESMEWGKAYAAKFKKKS